MSVVMLQDITRGRALCAERSHPHLETFHQFMAQLAIPRPRQLVLINPPQVSEAAFDPVVARHRGYYAYPPVGLLYIAAVAKDVNPNIEVRILDLNYEMLYQSVLPDFTYHFWHELLHDTIEGCDAPYVGIIYLFGATKHPFLQVSQWLREHYPDVPILAGGVQATYDFQELLRANSCDIVFRKEAERQFHAFMQHCTGQEPEAIPWGSAFGLTPSPRPIRMTPRWPRHWSGGIGYWVMRRNERPIRSNLPDCWKSLPTGKGGCRSFLNC